MALSWATFLGKLNALPGFSATAQHVALFKDLYEQSQKDSERLTKECDALRAENEELKKQVGTSELPADLVDVEGLLWKRRSDGTYESKPRCPQCADHPVMSTFPPGGRMYWLCSQCRMRCDFADSPNK